jgi:hypothetical protein
MMNAPHMTGSNNQERGAAACVTGGAWRLKFRFCSAFEKRLG